MNFFLRIIFLLLVIKSYSQQYLTGKISYINKENQTINLEGVSIFLAILSKDIPFGHSTSQAPRK